MSIIYARIAKFSVIALILLISVAFLVLVATQHNLGVVHTTAQVFFLALFIPALLIIQFFRGDPIDKELQRFGFQINDEMTEAIGPLLKGVKAEVRIGIYPSHDVNAFAISSITGRRATIGFSTALLGVANAEQIYAIAAHEVSHVKNGDSQNKLFILAFHTALEALPKLFAILATSILKSFAWAIGLVVLLLLVLTLISGQDLGVQHLSTILWPLISKVWPAPAAIFAAWLLRYALQYTFLAYSRGREYAADAGAAEMTSASSMLAALELFPNQMDAFSIFDSHPPLKERKRRLQLKLKTNAAIEQNHDHLAV